jgi:hypothetical protein
MRIPSAGNRAMGTAAISVRRGDRWIMKASAKPPPAMVLVKYMIAGPTAMRTALKSFVNRAIRSPVRIRV